MIKILKNFALWCVESDPRQFSFWAIPIGSLLLVWLLTIVLVKVLRPRTRMKKVFVIGRTTLLSSFIVAAVLIACICLGWSENYFATHPWQIPLLTGLALVMCVPVVILMSLRGHFTRDGLRNITDQPKTPTQLNATITQTKRAFRSAKLLYAIPLAGFLFLLLSLWQGTNLISIVYDNSASMEQTTATEALTQTFTNLQDNNEIVFTTLDGKADSTIDVSGMTLKSITSVQKSSGLKSGNVSSFPNPTEAIGGLSQINNECYGSPICEGIWKSYLYIQETKANQEYAHQLLIVMTDGNDNYLGESLASGPFLFDDPGFDAMFPSEKVFIIDYSGGTPNPFMTRCEAAGCDIYPAANSVDDYLAGLDNALKSFKNNWSLIWWALFFFGLPALLGLLIQPKKIA